MNPSFAGRRPDAWNIFFMPRIEQKMNAKNKNNFLIIPFKEPEMNFYPNNFFVHSIENVYILSLKPC